MSRESPSAFLKELLKLIASNDDLRRFTVSGKTSNRSNKENAFEKLPEKIFRGCGGNFQHFLSVFFINFYFSRGNAVDL